MSMRKLLATSAAMSLLAVQFLCGPHQRALANPFTCQEVPGGELTSAKPAAGTFTHWAINVVELYIRGLDNRIYRNASYENRHTQWTGWSEVEGGGLTLSAPAAVVEENSGSTLIFVRSYDDLIYQSNLGGTGWSEVPGNGLTLSGEIRQWMRGSGAREDGATASPAPAASP